MRRTHICRVITVVLFVLSVLLSPMGFLKMPVFAVSEEPTKVYCNATLDDEFTPNEVIVVISPAYNAREYTASDFSEIGCTA